MKIAKKIFLSIGLLVAGFASAQVNPGDTPCEAGCSTVGSYPSSTGNPGLGSWGCLGSTPNPNWIAIGVGASGNINLSLTQVNSGGGGIDVDFGVFGPFTSVSAGCSSLVNGVSPMVDCSFSASATESIDIPGALAGQVYIILITNYNGSAGTISVTPTTGTINCAIDFSVSTTMTPAKCSQANGSVTATPNGGFAPYTYSWNIPGNPTTATVNNVPPGTYTVTVTSSPNPTTGQTVNPTTGTVTVTNQVAVFSAVSTPASCPNGHNGTATANFTMQGGIAGLTATYAWNDPAGQTTKTALGLLPGSYTCTVTLSNGCTGTATVTVGANAVAYNATSTIVSCPGGSDGTATATMAPVVGNLSYAWSDPAAQTTATAYNLSAGAYTCTITSDIGCTGTVSVTVNEIPGMTSNFTTIENVTCNSHNDGVLGVTVGQGTAPYSYSWDNSSSTSYLANDLYVGQHIVTITDNNGCIIKDTMVLTEPPLLQIMQLSGDAYICPESSTTLSVTGTGGSSDYIFTWSENGTTIGTGPSIIVDPSTPVTQYCVTMTEVCGSPSTDSCLTLTFPTPIPPKYVMDKLSDCEPATVEFYLALDDMSLTSEIQSILLEFGDGEHVLLENGIWDTSHVYQSHGVYISSATITSIHGCVTNEDALTTFTAIQLPVADFTFSANPTTMFETTVKMQDKSTSTVTEWEWESLSSVPSASTQQNPEFTYPEGYTGVYDIQLIVKTPEGCVDTVHKTLTVISDILFFAPNAFTPDGDEFNQTWKFSVDGIDRYNFELAIYNRWGEIIWETKDADASWDGTYHGEIVPPGAYSWKAKVKALESDEKREFLGVITIVR